MTTAQEIEDKLENVSILSDCFEEDDDMWGDDNNENQPPLQSHGGDGSKRGTAMAPSLTPIHEESRISTGSTDYGRRTSRDFDELTERTQGRTPIDYSPARELSIEYKSEPFVPMSNVSAELRREQEAVYAKNRFRLPDDEQRRSWENNKSHDSAAMGSLLLPKSGQSSFNNEKSGRTGSRASKIVTSTPKGATRGDNNLSNSFEDCPLSTIECNSPISKMSLGSFIGFGDTESHTGSTLSHSKIGNAIKDIKLADDSIDAATQLMSHTQARSKDFKSSRPTMNLSKAELSQMNDFQIYQATGMVPKRSYRKKKEVTVDPRLAEITQTLDALEAQSLRSQNEAPRLSSSLRPSTARESTSSSRADKTYPVDRPMSVRDRTPTPTDPSALIAVKPFPISHFGFVAVNEHIILSVTVTNLSKSSIHVRPELKEGVFTLLEKSSVVINGNEQFSFPVKFTPDQRARYKANLMLKVKSSDKTIIHGLLGFGGAANLKVFTNKALRMCPSLSYIMFPTSLSNFSFDVANDGERAGFVIVQAVDDDSNVIPGITVTPDRFLMLTNENAKSYKEKWEQSINVTVRPETLRNLHDHARNSHGRLSSLSRASGSTSGRSSLNGTDHLFNLKMVWGDERFRQRAKKQIHNSGAAHPIVHGIPITKLTFINNEEETMAKNSDGFLTAQDVETFQAQICVTTIRVGNQRPMQGSLDRLSSRPSSAASNQDVPEGFYIPTLHDNGLNESRISIAPSTDRTVMPSSKTKRY